MDEEITLREHEVLQFLASGKTIKEIAELLFIAETTVTTHREKLKEKLDCKMNSYASTL